MYTIYKIFYSIEHSYIFLKKIEKKIEKNFTGQN